MAKKQHAGEGLETPAPKSAASSPAEQVLRWILDGASETDIVEAVGRIYPGEKAKPLIVEAFATLERAGDRSDHVILGWCLEATRELYRRMVEIGDFPGALRAIKQMADLGKDAAEAALEQED